MNMYPLKRNEIVKEIWRMSILSVAPPNVLVETFSVGLVETCFNYPIAALYAIIHLGADRTNK